MNITATSPSTVKDAKLDSWKHATGVLVAAPLILQIPSAPLVVKAALFALAYPVLTLLTDQMQGLWKARMSSHQFQNKTMLAMRVMVILLLSITFSVVATNAHAKYVRSHIKQRTDISKPINISAINLKADCEWSLPSFSSHQGAPLHPQINEVSNSVQMRTCKMNNFIGPIIYASARAGYSLSGKLSDKCYVLRKYGRDAYLQPFNRASYVAHQSNLTSPCILPNSCYQVVAIETYSHDRRKSAAAKQLAYQLWLPFNELYREVDVVTHFASTIAPSGTRSLVPS